MCEDFFATEKTGDKIKPSNKSLFLKSETQIFAKRSNHFDSKANFLQNLLNKCQFK